MIFLPSCNFKCGFCHNHQLTYHWKNLPLIPEEKILRFLRDHRKWLDGLVISGGEPTLFGKRLESFLRKVKRLEMPVSIHTNGTNPELLSRLVSEGLVEHLAVDIKTRPEEKAYSKTVNADPMLDKLRETIRLVISSGIDHEFRTTMVPGLVSEEDVVAIARSLEGARRYVLQQFKPDNARKEEFRKLEPYSQEKLEGMASTASVYLPTSVR